MTTLPQYARSTDPDVIAAVERNRQHELEFHRKIQALSEKWTGEPDNAWYNRGGGGSVLIGLRMTREQIEDAQGQWKKPDRNGAVRPYKSNSLSEEFSIAAKHEDVPGRPSLLWGQNWMGGGSLFVLDGAAWSGVGFVPSAPSDERWTEVLASEFHAAVEAVNAARKGQS